MDNQPNTPETVPGTPEGGGNDSVPSAVSFYEALNHVQGTSFKSDEEAVAGLKETARYVGKLNKFRGSIEALEKSKGGEAEALAFLASASAPPKEEPQAPKKEAKAADGDFVSKEQYEMDTWFARNQKHEAHADLLKALKAANPGKSWDEVADLPAYRELVDKAEAGSQNNAGDLTPSTRIAANSAEYEKDFKEAKASGNWLDFMAKHKGFKFDD